MKMSRTCIGRMQASHVCTGRVATQAHLPLRLLARFAFPWQRTKPLWSRARTTQSSVRCHSSIPNSNSCGQVHAMFHHFIRKDLLLRGGCRGIRKMRDACPPASLSKPITDRLTFCIWNFMCNCDMQVSWWPICTLSLPLYHNRINNAKVITFKAPQTTHKGLWPAGGCVPGPPSLGLWGCLRVDRDKLTGAGMPS